MSETARIKNGGRRQGRDWPKHVLISLLLAGELLPFYMMLQMSIQDHASWLSSPWLPGNPLAWVWTNYVEAAQLVLPFVANTLVVALTVTVGSLVLALMGAYFFARYKMPFSGALWAAFLWVMFLPTAVNIVPLFALLKNLNLLNTLYALIILGIAGGQIFCIVVLRHFIEAIPKDLFEAAEMDGASHLAQLRNVVIPMCGPILGTLAILQFLGTWNDFLMPLIVLRDPELFTIGVGLIDLEGEHLKEWGKIMAAFSIASLPLMILFLFTVKCFVRGFGRGALKG